MLKRDIYYSYKYKSLKVLFDYLIMNTILALLVLFFYNENIKILVLSSYTIVFFFQLIILVRFLKINNYCKLILDFLPLIILLFSFINVVYNYLPMLYCIAGFNYKFIVIFIITVLLLSFGLYTFFLLRSNADSFYCRTSTWESLKQTYQFLKLILNNTFILCVLILIFIVFFSIRFFIFKNIPFTVTLLYFNLFCIIIFSLWSPSLYIFVKIITYYSYVDFDYKYFKQQFNF